MAAGCAARTCSWPPEGCCVPDMMGSSRIRAGVAPSQLPVHGVPADDLGFVRHDRLIQQRLLRAGGYSDDPADKKLLAQAKRCTGDAPLRRVTASSRQPLGGTPDHAHLFTICWGNCATSANRRHQKAPTPPP